MSQQPMPSLAPTYPVPLVQSGQGPRVANPVTPMPLRNTAGSASPLYGVQSLPDAAPQSPATTPVQAPAPLPPTRRRRGLFIALVALVILVLLGGGLGGFLWFTRAHIPAVVSGSQMVGHAYFISSGQVSETSNQGINDQVLIDLQNVPNPAAGNTYYAWLLPDLAQPLSAPVALGVVPVVNGRVHYLYRGDNNHTNLLASGSRFLITEESASTPPSNPSPDKST